MFIPKPQPSKFITKMSILMLSIIMVLSGMNFQAVAEYPDSTTEIFINSSFLFFKDNEKLIDDEFNITILHYNETSNSTAIYNIQIDDLNYNGTFQFLKVIEINVTGRELISFIQISLNNKIIYELNNLIIIAGLDSNNIKRSLSIFTINLSPFEWNAKEWNIVFSLIMSFLISIFIAYEIVKYYRKHSGIKKV